MRSKLMRIKLERFQKGKPLAREIFLDLPVNQKMIRVVAAGDDIRTGLLERLPRKGVQALYAKPLEGEHHDPDTQPIYVDAAELKRGTPDPAQPKGEFAQEDISARLYPDMTLEEARVVPHGASEGAARAEELKHWQEEAEHFARKVDPDMLHTFSSGESLREINSRNSEPSAQEEPDDPFFPRQIVEEYQKIAAKKKPSWIHEEDGPERAPETWVREEEKPSYVFLRQPPKAPLEHKELADALMKVVRHFASAGEHYRSLELKQIAGALARVAHMFFVVSRDQGRASEAATRVLVELREIRKELRILALRDGYTNNERLNKALEHAIRDFKRGVKLPSSSAA